MKTEMTQDTVIFKCNPQQQQSKRSITKTKTNNKKGSVEVTLSPNATNSVKKRSAVSLQTKSSAILDVELGMTQTAVAKKYGVNQSMVQRWMVNKHNIEFAINSGRYFMASLIFAKIY